MEDSLNIPKGQFEIPLIMQDRLFNPDGTLLYPMADGGTHQFWIPEFFGDTMCVNGKAWPVLDVEPRRYRFRMLNGCNARFLNMTLVRTDGRRHSAWHGRPAVPCHRYRRRLAARSSCPHYAAAGAG